MSIDPLPLLARLARTPAAPFHEEGPATEVLGLLAGAGIAARRDPYGNILARVRRGAPALRVAMVAHLDHPAFEVTGTAAGALAATLLGGVRPEALPPGTPVRVHTARGWKPAAIADTQRTEAGEVVLTLAGPEGAAPGDWGVWEMPEFVQDGDLVRMRACDDLAGCASILAALLEAAAGDWPVDLTGVFTRAEEVGLVGATLVAQQGLLPPATVVISVESSRRLPGAELGRGPVIRVGDARSTFDAAAEALLQAAAAALRSDDTGFGVQRQLMSGGTCEATAFAQHGYRVTGIALPLGNYHNVPDALHDPDGATRDPGQARVAPEFVHRNDLRGAARLLGRVARLAASPPPAEARMRLALLAARHRDRLRSTAGGEP